MYIHISIRLVKLVMNGHGSNLIRNVRYVCIYWKREGGWFSEEKQLFNTITCNSWKSTKGESYSKTIFWIYFCIVYHAFLYTHILRSWSSTDCAYGDLMLSTSLRVGRGTHDIILSIWFIVDVPGKSALPEISDSNWIRACPRQIDIAQYMIPV